MNEMFQPESPLIRALTRTADCIILNLLLMGMTVSIVLSGDGLVALYAVTLRMVRKEEGSITKNYFRSVRCNFSASVPVTFILMADVFILAILYYSLRAEVLVMSPGKFVLLMTMAVVLTAFLSYLIPLTARFDNSFAGHCGNALKLAVSNYPLTVMMTVINMAPFLTVAMIPRLSAFFVPFWMTIGVAAGAYLNSYYLRRIFDKYTGNEEENEQAYNGEQL